MQTACSKDLPFKKFKRSTRPWQKNLRAAPIFSALYRFGGKTILLIRISSYSPAEGFESKDYVATYKAILDQYEDLADLLVIDQTHNPGGQVSYVNELARIFATKPMGAFVQAQRADRKWIEELRAEARKESDQNSEAALQALSAARLVEKAYDAREFLSKPMPFSLSPLLTAGDYTWKKPVLIAIDEMAGSGGDAFPMIMKNGGRAKLFGKRTMGLGGSVEGVLPDVPYEHSVEDFRSGDLNYFRALSGCCRALIAYLFGGSKAMK